MWSQIVGKIRMAHAPSVNHWWHVTLYPTARGLGTSAIPYANEVFDLEFDFVDHVLRIRVSDVQHLQQVVDRFRRGGDVIGTKTLMVLGAWRGRAPG